MSARTELRELAELVAAVAVSPLMDQVEVVAQLVTDALREGGFLFFCGNGGSAAEAQHMAAEYVVRFRRERRALGAMALTVDASVLTAAANDYGFRTVFSRQLEAIGRPGDVLFLYSTSGQSENLLVAAEAARDLRIHTVGILAKGGGELRGLVDDALVVPTNSTARAQELHLAIGHAICEIVDRNLGGIARF